MIIDTRNIKVGDLFSNSDSKFFSIPKYQREYTWTQKNWETLFNDVVDNDPGYFLGSIICMGDNTSTFQTYKEFELIDGQQRITSLSILLIALYDKLSVLKPLMDGGDEDEFEQKTKLTNLKWEIADKKDKTSKELLPRLKPQVQNDNRNDYLRLLTEVKIIKDFPKPQDFAKRRIYKAFKFFGKLIDDYLQNKGVDGESAIEPLFELVDKFNETILVAISVNNYQDAYMLFESLNNRGVPLSAIDLIKNMLIRKADKDEKAGISYDKWSDMLHNLTDEYNIQERFFRQYYNAFRKELNVGFPVPNGRTKYALGAVATRSTIIGIYNKLIEKDYNKTLDSLLQESKNYALLIDNSEDPIDELTKPLRTLIKIQGAPSYILLMYLLSKRQTLKIDNNMIKRIIKDLIIFFVRRNVTDTPSTQDLNRIFVELNESIEKLRGTDVLDEIEKTLKEKSVSDTIYKEHLKGNMYEDNADVTRFLLCYYEEKFQTKESYQDLWRKDDKDKFIWTIEHIFPEGVNIPQTWVEMIADGDKEKANELRLQYTHKLGNLTLTGYNSALSNMSFEHKKTRKKDNLCVGYMNGLTLNKDVVNKTKWTIDVIEERTDKLVDFFMEEFSLDNMGE